VSHRPGAATGASSLGASSNSCCCQRWGGGNCAYGSPAHHPSSRCCRLPDWALLQVYFSNAFNLVRRDVFCQSTLEHFPALGPWVTSCYDSPSHLFFEGEIVCNSARGVQQGDPLGPLLFCLVLRHVSLGIPDIFASAEPTAAALNKSYVDDEVIGPTLGTLSRVLSYLQSPQVQDLGLSLNVAKCSVYQPSSQPIPHLFPVDIHLAYYWGTVAGGSHWFSIPQRGDPGGGCGGPEKGPSPAVVCNTHTCPVHS
jgi:hypothetical protein